MTARPTPTRGVVLARVGIAVFTIVGVAGTLALVPVVLLTSYDPTVYLALFEVVLAVAVGAMALVLVVGRWVA